MPEIGAALRAEVRSRADGRCEYRLVPETLTLVSHEVDHIIAAKHGGETSAENLALCCTLCNKYKGTDLASIDPETGDLQRLFHPRRDQWHEHFQLRGGALVALTALGRVTVRLLQLNRSERVKERELMIQAGLLLLLDSRRIVIRPDKVGICSSVGPLEWRPYQFLRIPYPFCVVLH